MPEGHFERVPTRKNEGASGRIRTCDTWYRKPVLYPLSYGGGIVPGEISTGGTRPENRPPPRPPLTHT